MTTRVACRKAVFDNAAAAEAIAQRDGFRADLVVGADHADLVGALQFRNRALGDEQGIGQNLRLRSNVAILTWPKRVPRIREAWH